MSDNFNYVKGFNLFGVKARQIPCLTGKGEPNIVSSIDRLFILAVSEVCNDHNYAGVVPYCNEIDSGAEEITFSVFTDNNSRIKKLFNNEGSSKDYFLRSPIASSSTNFFSIASTGSVYSRNDYLGGPNRLSGISFSMYL